MFRSVKSQIIAATSVIILVILSANAYFILDQKRKEINFDIFQKAVSFAELTHERVVSNYELNYEQNAFANFNRELAEVYNLNEDIDGLGIYNYSGEMLYESDEDAFDGLSDEELERIQATFPSVLVKKSGRVAYLEKSDEGVRFTNFNGKDVEPVTSADQIENIVFPFKDPNNALRAYSIKYDVSYDALLARIIATTRNILLIAALGIIIAIFIGGVVAHRITKPIQKLKEGADKIGDGDLKTRIEVTSKSEVGQLANTFNQMAADLEKSTEELVEKEKLTRELELAGEIQQELLPKELPKISNLDIAASLVPATEVGGDAYDFLIKNEDLIFYVGDVTGHGVPAGLVSAINNALVPAILDHYDSTDDLVVNLNKIIKQKTRPNVFMTLVMARWNEKKAELSFTQAGHDPILHFSAKKTEVAELSTGGMALGMVDDLTPLVKTDAIAVEKDDVLVMYTDGIPEAWKNDKENLGMDKFKEIIKTHSNGKSAQEIHDNIVKDVRDFMGSYPQADDITLVVVKRTS